MASLTRERGPQGLATLPGSSPDFVFIFSVYPSFLQELSRRIASFCPGQCFWWAGLWAGRRVLGLGLWGNGGGCGPALASRPPSSLSGSASPLPDQPLDTGQAPGLPATQLCAFPHRRTPLACSTPSDSLLPWPLATAVSWQEVGTRLYRSHSLVCKGLRARRSEAVDGQHTAAGPGTARPVAGSCRTCGSRVSPSPGFWVFSFFFPP